MAQETETHIEGKSLEEEESMIPMVSVIIPTYNRAHLVGRAIQSVLDQAYQDLEVLVVNDGFADNTEEVVGSFNDSRIHYIHHDENRGCSAARNTGIAVARGEYLAFLDSDDEWLPETLQRPLGILQNADENVGLVYSGFVYVYPNGKVKRHKEVLNGVSVGWTSRWLVKRKVFQEVGRFDETMPALEDAEVSIRICQKYAALYEPSIMMRYYVTKNSVSKNAKNTRLAVDKLIKSYKDIVTRDELANWYLMLGNSYVIEGKMGKGRALLFKAASLCPLNVRRYPIFFAALLGRRTYLWLKRRRALARGIVWKQNGGEKRER